MQRYVVQMQIKVIYGVAIALGGQLTMARRWAPPFLTMQFAKRKREGTKGGRRERRRVDRLRSYREEQENQHRDLKRVSIRCLRSRCRNRVDVFDINITKCAAGVERRY